MVLPPFCLLCATCLVVTLQQLWSFKEGTRVVLQQLHRNRTFWIWATAERPNHFSGRSKVAALCNTPFTQGLRPLCLPCATTKLARSPLKAEERPNGCLGRSRLAHRTFRHRHGRHGRREVLNMFKTDPQRSPRRSVAHRSLKGGRMKAHTSLWSQNGCTVVGHWSPS